MIKLSKIVTRSAKDYVDALLEACTRAGVDPVEVLIDTASYTKVTREMEMSEFIVGWFHGVAESHDIEVDSRKDMTALWMQVADGRTVVAAAPKRAPKASKAKPEVHRAHPPKRAPRPAAPVVAAAAPAPTPPKATGKTTVVDLDAHASFTAANMPTPGFPPPRKVTRRKRTPAAQTALLMDSPTPPPADPATHAAATATLTAMRKQRGQRSTPNG